MPSRCFCCILCLILVSGFGLVWAQNVATISGQVTDQSGAILPGATVQITNEDTGIIRALVTDAEGRYRARELALGRYRIAASQSGFQTVVRTGVVLTIGREAVVDFKLPIGEITTEVQVTGDAPLVETTRSDMAGLVTQSQVSNLPLNARDFSQLINLQAGTTYYRNQAGDPVSGLGARISVSGARPTANSFTLDGSDINTAMGPIPSGVTGAVLGVESMREFTVLTGNYSARYGRAAGANIIAVTKSGTNEFHGSLYEYLRNDNLDARNFFDQNKLEFKRNQFGASLGGPVVKNKIFFFGNYEGLRERLPMTFRPSVPTAQARQGILPGRTVTVNPAVKPYLSLWPLPNGRDFGDGTAEYITSGNRPTNEDYVTARVDYQANEKNALFVRYTYDNSVQYLPQSIPFYKQWTKIRNQYVTVEDRMVITSHLVNLFRIAYSRPTQQVDLVGVNPPDPSLSFLTGRPFGSIDVSGIASLSGYTGQIPRLQFLNTSQLYDDVDFDLGRHSLKFGGSLTLFLFNKIAPQFWGGTWSFGSLQNFLLNSPTSLRIAGLDADACRSYKQYLVAWYIQDDFRLRPGFTLNMGVRYDYTSVPTERYGRIADLRSYLDPQTTVGNPLYDNPSGLNFGPRVGLAWDPTGSGKSSIRAGFGVFFDPLVMKYYITPMDRQPPFWKEIAPAAADMVGLFPKLDARFATLAAGPQSIHSFDFAAHSPYSMQWGLSVQRTIRPSLVAELAYSGARGIHLGNRSELAVPQHQTVNGVTYFPANATLPNPNFTRNQKYGTGARSEYHAFKTIVTKRYSGGLSFQGAYTWSKAMDTQSSNLQNELGATSHMDVFDENRDWALADFHVTHVFMTNFIWEMPFGRQKKWGTSWNGLVNGFLGGWQLNGIFMATTGTPVNVNSNSLITHPLVKEGSRADLIAGGNNNPVLGGPDRYFDTTQFKPQQKGYYGNVGRNTLIGPGLVDLDLSVMKAFSVREGKRIQFRAEMFNLPNRPNFRLPSTTLFNSQGLALGAAGRITGIVTTARQVQLALRFEF